MLKVKYSAELLKKKQEFRRERENVEKWIYFL
jgi:hypothetical protein